MYKENRESIVLMNQDQKVFGVFHHPIGVENAPAILICHGLAGDKTGKYRVYVKLSEMLAQHGIASLRIDFRGSGDSEGDFTDMTLESEVSDALKSLEYLEKSKLIDPNRLGIFGRSLGGTVAIMTARSYKKINSIVTWAPLSDGDQWLEQWHKLNAPGVDEEFRKAATRVNGQVPGEEFFKQLFNLRVEDELKELNGIPFLHVHGEQDVVVVTEHHANRFAKMRTPKNGKTKFLRLPKSDHDFSDPEEQKIALQETCQWFLDTL